MTPRGISKGIARHLQGLLPGRRRPHCLTLTDEYDRLVSRADGFRDCGDWIGAEDCYRRALELLPDRAAIWIQRGHALKESGRCQEGLACYLQADRLEPGNSDTALQIGHVLKILNRPTEAITWYERAASWVPPQQDAFVELEHLGYPTTPLRVLMDGADLDRSADTVTCSERRRLVFWDVSGFVDAQLAHRSPPLLDQWLIQLLDSMATEFSIHPCCLDPDTLSWRACPSPHMPGARFNFDALVTELIEHARGTGVVDAILVLPVMPTQVPASRIRFACDILRNTHDARYLLLVPPLASVCEQPRDHSRASTTGGLEDHPLVDELLGLSASVLLADFCDCSSLRDARNARAIPVHRADDNRLSVHKMEASPDLGGRRTFDLVVMPDDASELRSILSAYRLLATRRVVKLATTHSWDAVSSHSSAMAQAADDFAAAGISPSEAMEAMTSAAVVLVPASCRDRELWARLAADAGARVIASSAPGSVLTHCSLVTTLPDFTDTTRLAQRWLHLAGQPAADDFARGRWLPALTRALDDCVQPNQAGWLPPIAIGDFFSFAHGGTGLALRASRGWHEPAAYGSLLAAERGKLRLAVRPFSHSPVRIQFLFGSPEGSRYGMRVHATIDGTATGQVDLRTPAAGWGWGSLTLPLRPRSQRYIVDLDLQVLPTDAESNGAGVAVAGIFLYHESRDHVWFEFLERASRGEVREIRSIRAWSTLASCRLPATATGGHSPPA